MAFGHQLGGTRDSLRLCLTSAGFRPLPQRSVSSWGK
jgi:hypothetical protein